MLVIGRGQQVGDDDAAIGRELSLLSPLLLATWQQRLVMIRMR